MTNGTPLNLADFDPQWNEANLVNFVDTSGNMFTVPTNVPLAGGYKKLIFLNHNGQATFLVATIIGTTEYLIRKNGHCTINDFCGYIYYTNTNGVSTGGYKFDNGIIVGLLTPKTGPRPEFEPDTVLDVFTVTAKPWNSGGGTNLGIFSLPVFSNYTNFINNTFSFDAAGASGSSANSSMDGSTPPPVNANLCPTTFVVSDNPANFTKDMGIKGLYMPMLLSDGTVVPLGFNGLSIHVPRTNGQGQLVSDSAAADIAAKAVNIAQGLLQLRISRDEVAPTDAARKREFIKLASQYINERSGLNPQPLFPRVTWEQTITTRPLMVYRDPITGCP